MAAMDWIRFVAGACFLVLGLLTFLVEMIGVFRFRYVLNRMHAAAIGDTLGIGFSLVGLILMNGLNFTSLKMFNGNVTSSSIVVFTYILMGFLIVCAISVSFSKNLLNSILIFMSYSLIMSVIWIILESPDLAITEAAVGAGVTSILFFVTLKKIHAIVESEEE